MRMTLSIDDDVLMAVKSLAQREHKSIGEVLADLARQELRRGDMIVGVRNGIPLLPHGAGGEAVSLEPVNERRDGLP